MNIFLKTHVVGTHYKCLGGMLLMSVITCFSGETRKKNQYFLVYTSSLSEAMYYCKV